jgi:hypothetical protein
MTRLTAVARDDKRWLVGLLCGLTLYLAASLLLGQRGGSLAVWSHYLASQYWPHIRQFLHSVAAKLISWHWGTLATVAVAATAIIVSIVTLRRNAAQFEQQRRDARDDKLRTEIANLTAAMNEIRHKIFIAVERSTELTRSITGEADPNVRRLRYTTGINAVLGQEVSGTYLRINSHAVTIIMTTSDDAITHPVVRIIEAARKQQSALETMLAQPGQAAPRLAQEFTPEIRRQSETMEAARKELLNYGHDHWATS